MPLFLSEARRGPLAVRGSLLFMYSFPSKNRSSEESQVLHETQQELQCERTRDETLPT